MVEMFVFKIYCTISEVNIEYSMYFKPYYLKKLFYAGYQINNHQIFLLRYYDENEYSMD